MAVLMVRQDVRKPQRFGIGCDIEYGGSSIFRSARIVGGLLIPRRHQSKRYRGGYYNDQRYA